MEIYTYRAASLQEALMLVRHELGPDASILQTREIGGRFFGLLGKRSIEVEASRDAQVVRRLAHSEPSVNYAQVADDKLANADDAREAVADRSDNIDRRATAGGQPAFSKNRSQRTSSVTSSGQTATGHVALDDRDEANTRHTSSLDLTEDDPMIDSQMLFATDDAPSSPIHRGAHEARPNHLSPAMFEVFTELLDADVDPDAARHMLQEVAMHCSPQQLNDPWLIKGRLCQLVQQRINVAGPIDLGHDQQHIVALIGPTGVGKTTTLAKLAAGFHFDQGLQVGFITLDTFRLGAIDQLQKYAELLGAPCEVVSAPDQMLAALERLAHCHLILIDTAGRSPRDEAQLGALSDFLRVAQPTQTHLVLSAASSQAHAEMTIQQFRTLEPTHLLLTKLDESSSLGSWYRLLSSDLWPLSYITTGQNVPEDILAANRRRVASLILGQSSHIGSPRMR